MSEGAEDKVRALPEETNIEQRRDEWRDGGPWKQRERGRSDRKTKIERQEGEARRIPVFDECCQH